MASPSDQSLTYCGLSGDCGSGSLLVPLSVSTPARRFRSSTVNRKQGRVLHRGPAICQYMSGSESDPESEPVSAQDAADLTVVNISIGVANIHIGDSQPPQAVSAAASSSEAPAQESVCAIQQSSSCSSSAPAEQCVQPGPNTAEWDRRLNRAISAGQSARKVLHGEAARVDKTPRLPSLPARNRVWVIIQGAPHALDQGFTRTWAACQRRVCTQGSIDPQAIFHAFPSHEEARAYFNAALAPNPPAFSELQ